MIVVADTSPLNYLVRLDQIEILHQLYETVLVPASVFRELRHQAAPSAVRMWATAPPPWVEECRNIPLDATLPPALGAGEREALSLALTMRADLILIDETAGRREAAIRQLPMAGTLAVLLQAGLQTCSTFPECFPCWT